MTTSTSSTPVRFMRYTLPDDSSVNEILTDPTRAEERRRIRGIFSDKIARDIRLEGTDATRRFYEAYVCRGSKTKIPDFLRGQVKQSIHVVQNPDSLQEGLFNALYLSDLTTKMLYRWAKDEEIGKILLIKDSLKEQFFDPLRLLESTRFSKAVEGLENIMDTSKKRRSRIIKPSESKNNSSSSLKSSDFSNTQPGSTSSSRKKPSSKKTGEQTCSRISIMPARTHISIRNEEPSLPSLAIAAVREGEPSPSDTRKAFFPDSGEGDTTSDDSDSVKI